MTFDDDFDELAALAYRAAFRVLGSRSEAEEVAQETMIRALVRWRRVRSHGRAWVCRVAVNEAIGIIRKRRTVELSETPARAGGQDGAGDRIDLQRALLTLPRRQREVLVLRYLVDLPEAEVAEELGIGLGSVKTHAHRALAAMRIALPDHHSGPLEAFDV